MSLKKFHLFFITIAGIFCVFLLAWGLYAYSLSGLWFNLIYSAIGLVGAGGLFHYFRWFRHKHGATLTAFLLTSFLATQDLLACATCYQDPDNPMTKGALWGVGFLGVVIVGILVGIAYIGFSWVKRAKKLGVSL